jgi:hypothetical protein
MEIPEAFLGQTVDLCMEIWKKVKKNSSLRLNALKLLASLAKTHKDLNKDITLLKSPQYTEMLSENVKKSISKLTQNMS